MAELSIHAWIALAIMVGSIAVMMRASKKMPVSLIFIVGATLLVLTGCIDLKTAMKGFGTSTIALLVGLFIVVAGLENTGFISLVATRLLKKPKTLSSALVRLMVPVSILSSFILNVAVVALFSGVVKSWAKQLGIPASKLLLPMLYATKAGGLLLVIGVTSNLVIVSQYEQSTGNTLSLTFPILAGLGIVVVTILATLALRRLLPVRKLPEDEMEIEGTVTELKVPAENPFIGETLGDTPVGKAFLGEGEEKLLGIVRFDGEVIKNVTADEFLMGGDTLLLTGPKKSILAKGRSLCLRSNLMDCEPAQEMKYRLPVAVAISLIAVLVPLFFSNVSSALCFMAAAMLMIVTGCIKPDRVMKSIKSSIIILVGCSTAYAGALDATGLSQLMADSIVSWCGSSPLLALIILCTLSMILSDLLSCYVCPVMLTPIALNLSMTMGVNPLTFILGLMISCSCCVATPLGDGSKILTLVSGGYRFSDFLKIGIPMNLILLAVNILLSTMLFPLQHLS